MSRTSPAFYLIILILGLVVLEVSSVSSFIGAEWKLNKSIPVKVTIRTARIDQTPANDSSIYIPALTYTYKVNGQEFQGDQVALFTVENRNRNTVEALMKPFKPGRVCNGWYSADEHSTSFLIKHVPIYLLVVTWCTIVIVGFAIFFWMFMEHQRSCETELDPVSGWYLLSPNSAALQRAIAGGLLFLFAGLSSLTTVLIYMRQEPRCPALAEVLLASSVLISSFALIMIVFEFVLFLQFPRAQIFFDTSQPLPEEPFNAFIRQPLRSGLKIRSIEICLLCYQTVNSSKYVSEIRSGGRHRVEHTEKKVYSREWVKVGRNLEFDDGESVEIQQPLCIPNVPGAVSKSSFDDIAYNWDIVLRLRFWWFISYTIAFPLNMQEQFSKDDF